MKFNQSTVFRIIAFLTSMILFFSCNKEQVEPTEEEPEDVSDSISSRPVGGTCYKYVYVYEDQQLIESDYSITFPPEGSTKELSIVFTAWRTTTGLCIYDEEGRYPTLSYAILSEPTFFPGAAVTQHDATYVQLISISARENRTSETVSRTFHVYSDYYDGYGIRIHITQEPMTVVDE